MHTFFQYTPDTNLTQKVLKVTIRNITINAVNPHNTGVFQNYITLKNNNFPFHTRSVICSNQITDAKKKDPCGSFFVLIVVRYACASPSATASSAETVSTAATWFFFQTAMARKMSAIAMAYTAPSMIQTFTPL